MITETTDRSGKTVWVLSYDRFPGEFCVHVLLKKPDFKGRPLADPQIIIVEEEITCRECGQNYTKEVGDPQFPCITRFCSKCYCPVLQDSMGSERSPRDRTTCDCAEELFIKVVKEI